MSDRSAIRMLQTAIENVREVCSGPEYKDLLAACDTCDQACEKHDNESQPSDLKAAAGRVRQEFANRRSNK